eukprot:10651881-Ditylum_brightwellii.AAC.1
MHQHSSNAVHIQDRDKSPIENQQKLIPKKKSHKQDKGQNYRHNNTSTEKSKKEQDASMLFTNAYMNYYFRADQ